MSNRGRIQRMLYPRVEAGVVHAQGEYDLSGVGWAHLYSVRVPVTLNRWVVVEPGLTYLDYLSQASQVASANSGSGCCGASECQE